LLTKLHCNLCDVWCDVLSCRPSFSGILHTLESIDTSSCSLTAAVTGPVAQLTGLLAPTAEAVAAADAAEAAAARPPEAGLPALPGRNRPQQQQGAIMQGRGGGPSAASSRSPAKPAAGNCLAQGAMDWSEVS
jgi:hypothetical protein